jgi:hypothetical protein
MMANPADHLKLCHIRFPMGVPALLEVIVPQKDLAPPLKRLAATP